MKNQPISYIREKLTNKYGHYYSFILMLLLLCLHIHGQNTDNWTELRLIDTMEYAFFGTEHIPDVRYPPGQLFDADFSTCWVSRMQNNEVYPSVFMVVPKNISRDLSLNIFSGYGKSKSLFLKNARPEKIRISLHTAIVPDGYFSEHGMLCKILKSPYKESRLLVDTFGVQHIYLQNTYDKFLQYHGEALFSYKSKVNLPAQDTLILLELEIVSVFPGTIYSDVCISELFFNNCIVSSKNSLPGKIIKNVYLNEEENTLLIDSEEQKSHIVFIDEESILQIADLSPDKRWTVLLSIPREIGGRVETLYRLIDILREKDLSQEIENAFYNYTAGEPIFFKEKDGKFYLVIQELSGNEHHIELR